MVTCPSLLTMTLSSESPLSCSILKRHCMRNPGTDGNLIHPLPSFLPSSPPSLHSLSPPSQGYPQAIAPSDCAIYSSKLRYLLFQNYCRITVISMWNALSTYKKNRLALSTHGKSLSTLKFRYTPAPSLFSSLLTLCIAMISMTDVTNMKKQMTRVVTNHPNATEKQTLNKQFINVIGMYDSLGVLDRVRDVTHPFQNYLQSKQLLVKML